MMEKSGAASGMANDKKWFFDICFAKAGEKNSIKKEGEKGQKAHK